MADCTFLPWSMYTWVLQKRNTYMFLCKNMCFHLLCVTMINNCPRNLSISEFCNWEQRVQDASTHTQVVGQAIQYLSFSCRFSEARMLLESDLEFWSKTVPMLLEGSSNSARMFLQLFSNVPPILLERCSNAVWSTNRNWTKLTKPQYKQARTCRRYKKDQFLLQDQWTLRVRVFLYFVLPPPLPSSTHSIKTRLQHAPQRSGGWLLYYCNSFSFLRLWRDLLFFFIVGYGYDATFIVFLSLVFFLAICCQCSWEMVEYMCIVSGLFFFSLCFGLCFFLSFWVCV